MGNKRNRGFNCPHRHVGIVAAGDSHGDGPYAAVSTCAGCVREAQRHIHNLVGLPAGELITFEAHRAMREAS